jgi:hypothetical protein
MPLFGPMSAAGRSVEVAGTTGDVARHHVFSEESE